MTGHSKDAGSVQTGNFTIGTGVSGGYSWNEKGEGEGFFGNDTEVGYSYAGYGGQSTFAMNSQDKDNLFSWSASVEYNAKQASKYAEYQKQEEAKKKAANGKQKRLVGDGENYFLHDSLKEYKYKDEWNGISTYSDSEQWIADTKQYLQDIFLFSQLFSVP